ncbi:trimeric intracellular cation channel family protein [Streptomyces sp. NPDC001404]|uniref:trimeric intracellular cation channel family protein n=1 Tax=Streptomyces sp. NPDC001404 TaxID=3364571 RepID=UPI0036C085D1
MALRLLYLVGVSAFAAGGVQAAHRARLDPFGGLVLGMVSGVAGGTLRGLILGRGPLYWTRDWVLITVITATAVTVMVVLRHRDLPHRSLQLLDAMGLGVVTVIGAHAAIEAGVAAPAVLILAVLTGTAGEIVRDLLCGRSLPQLLHEEVYALAALAGASCFLLCDRLGWSGTGPALLGTAVVFALRVTAIRFGLQLPRLGRHKAGTCRLCRSRRAPEPRSAETPATP